MVINTNTQALAAASNLQTSSDMLAKSLSRLCSGSKITNPSDDAAAALVAVKAAINQLASDRASIGAFQSRLNFTSQQLVVSKENLSTTSSRIQDTDVAEESTQYARYQILVQLGTAMLAQANQPPQNVLQLLQ